MVSSSQQAKKRVTAPSTNARTPTTWRMRATSVRVMVRDYTPQARRGRARNWKARRLVHPTSIRRWRRQTTGRLRVDGSPVERLALTLETPTGMEAAHDRSRRSERLDHQRSVRMAAPPMLVVWVQTPRADGSVSPPRPGSVASLSSARRTLALSAGPPAAQRWTAGGARLTPPQRGASGGPSRRGRALRREPSARCGS